MSTTAEENNAPAFELPDCFPPSHPVVGGDGRTTWRAETAALIDGYRNLTVDVAVPPHVKPVPVVVWIHGGAFRMGQTEEVWSPWYSQMRERVLAEGFAFAAISYRFSREARYPAQLYDARAGLRYLRHFADVLGLDRSRVALWGGSAGAQIALLVAFTAGGDQFTDRVGVGGKDESVSAVVDYFGPTDPANLEVDSIEGGEGDHTSADSPLGLLLGHAPADNMAALEQLSPVAFVSPDAPPVLVVHGTADRAVGLWQSHRLVDTMTAVGASARLIEIPGADHGFADIDMTDVLDKTVCFIADHLK